MCTGRLIWGFSGLRYHFVRNHMSQLILLTMTDEFISSTRIFHFKNSAHMLTLYQLVATFPVFRKPLHTVWTQIRHDLDPNSQYFDIKNCFEKVDIKKSADIKKAIKNYPAFLYLLGNLHAFCCPLIFSKSTFFEKFFQKYHQSVKQFGSRSGPTFLSKLFAKVIPQMAQVGQEL